MKRQRRNVQSINIPDKRNRRNKSSLFNVTWKTSPQFNLLKFTHSAQNPKYVRSQIYTLQQLNQTYDGRIAITGKWLLEKEERKPEIYQAGYVIAF